MATSQRADQLGRVLSGRYRLTRGIRSSAPWRSYLAEDLEQRRRVAVTVVEVRPEADAALDRRLAVEARAASVFEHPNVVRILDWGRDDALYVVTEFCPGGSLRVMLDAGRLVGISQAVTAGHQIALALDGAHRRGFVHRDLQPEHLQIDGEGRVRVANLGLAEILAEAVGRSGERSPYMPPEQVPGRRLDARVDTYALAAVLVELVTGEVPAPREESSPALPPVLGRLRPLLDRCLQADVAARPDAGQLARALEQLAMDLEPPPRLPAIGALVRARPAGPTTTAPDVREPKAEEPVDDEHLDPVDEPTVAVSEVAAPLARHDAPARTERAEGDLRTGDARSPAGDEPTLLLGQHRADDPGAAPADDAVVPRRQPPFSTSGLALRARWQELRRRIPELDEVPWIVVLVVLLLVIIGAAVAITASRDAAATVPDVVGFTEQEARVLAGQAGAEADVSWEVVVEEQVSEDHPAGQVVSQDPAAGSALADGASLTIVVAQGPPVRELPDLSGRPEQEVVEELTAAGFEVGTAQRVADEEAPLGTVVGWTVDGEEGARQAAPGSEIQLIVSNGPPPSEVPAVAGLSADDARAALEGAGLAVEVVAERSPEVAAGLVVGSRPEAGTLVDRGTAVTLVVSEGPPAPEPGFGDGRGRGGEGQGSVTVPDVRGDRLRQAVRELREAGLDIGDVSGSWLGRVEGTDPAPGATVPRGARVRLRLG